MVSSHLWRIAHRYIPVHSFSRVRAGPSDPLPVEQEIGLRWGGPSDFSHVIDDGTNRNAGPEFKLDYTPEAPKYARILRSSAKVTTRLAKITGADGESYVKVRRFERMEFDFSEIIPRKRLDEMQRYRNVSFDLRFKLQPPDESKEDEEDAGL